MKASGRERGGYSDDLMVLRGRTRVLSVFLRCVMCFVIPSIDDDGLDCESKMYIHSNTPMVHFVYRKCSMTIAI